MSGPAIAFLVVGVLLNLGGIVLALWQDVAPSLGRVLKASATVPLKMTSRISGVTSPRDGATLEEKVAYLLRQDREAQKVHNALAGRVEDLKRYTVKGFDDVWAKTKRHVEEKGTEALNLYRCHRICGAIFLTAGLLCLVAASFV